MQKQPEFDHGQFVTFFTAIQRECHDIAMKHGWWDEPRTFGDITALFHSEITEAFEAYRNGDPGDKDCPDFSNREVELADCIIRIMDYAEKEKLLVAEALIAKMKFNRTRPYRHGGKKA